MRRRHHTFEAKLRTASTLLRLGKTKKSCFALTLIAKFTFHLSLFYSQAIANASNRLDLNIGV